MSIVLCATTSIVVGSIWDVSSHMTIGPGGLWSPPHLLEQLGAGIAAIVCGSYAIWLTFFATPPFRERSVRLWGLHGPLGGWVCIWGALVTIASLRFDTWWNNARGFDGEILSPPHAVLTIGILGIQFGTLLLALAAKNRAGPEAQKRYGRIYAFSIGGLLLTGALGSYESIAYANEWHAAAFYCTTALIFPVMLVGAARISSLRWAATIAAASYMTIMLVTLWILQLVPFEPRLASTENPVNHMVPLAFPLLLLAPALLIDLLEQRLRGRSDGLIAICSGTAFVIAMLAVHWPFGSFMLSAAARNFVFGADLWPNMYDADAWRHDFWSLDLEADGSWSATRFALGVALAALLGIWSSRVGLLWGNFARRVVR